MKDLNFRWNSQPFDNTTWTNLQPLNLGWNKIAVEEDTGFGFQILSTTIFFVFALRVALSFADKVIRSHHLRAEEFRGSEGILCRRFFRSSVLMGHSSDNKFLSARNFTSIAWPNGTHIALGWYSTPQRKEYTYYDSGEEMSVCG